MEIWNGSIAFDDSRKAIDGETIGCSVEEMLIKAQMSTL